MNNPSGMTIDETDQLWVTENDFQPKRVSVWTLDGKFIKAFYGPS
jgi:sugar lactone lactonase YvrE